MRSILIALALFVASPVSATPQNPDYINAGQCAGNRYSKCRYTLDIITAEDGEAMVFVPGLEWMGPSRISTVEFCVETQGTNAWQNLITDSDYELMEGCLLEVE